MNRTPCIANPDVIFKDEGEDGALLFNPKTSEVKIVNATGALIFKQLDGKCTVAEIASNLEGIYEKTEGEDIEGHVEEFIDMLIEKGLAGIQHSST